MIIAIVTLLVSIATLYVSYITYRYAKMSDRKRIKGEIKCKEALLRTMNDRFFLEGMDYTVADRMRAEKKLLEVEIEELKKQL